MSGAPARRFPAPWTLEAIPGGFRIIDSNGVALAYVYSRDDLAEKTIGGAHLTSDEAKRIASNIARLPELLVKGR